MAHITKWDLKLLGLAKFIAQWSKDPSTQVGCILADSRHRILSTGFNGFPAGVRDTRQRLQNREVKLLMTQHAERNAIAFSAHDLVGATAYVWPLPPCAACGGALIQAGIARIVTMELTQAHDRWENDTLLAFEMYAEAGIIFDTVSVLE